MAEHHAAGAGVIPNTIPADGLREVLRAWSGRGMLAAVTAVQGSELSDLEWRPSDVLRRANRILFETLRDIFRRLPDHIESWRDAIPARIRHTREVSQTVPAGVSWTDTWRNFGWPPTSFSARSRIRGADAFLVSTAAWTLRRAVQMYEDATSYQDAEEEQLIDRKIDVVARLLDEDPFSLVADSGTPTVEDVRSLRSEGRPWTTVAAIAEHVVRLEREPWQYALQLLMPDDEIRWRLFHLGVLGEVLLGLTADGCAITSVRPLGMGANGPAYEVMTPNGEKWDLWFEGSGCWKYYGADSPYLRISHDADANYRALGPDILLIRHPVKALLLECKYYELNPEKMARNGYLQAAAYASEASTSLVDEVISAAVCPWPMIQRPGWSDSIVGKLGIIPHTHVRDLVTDLVAVDMPA